MNNRIGQVRTAIAFVLNAYRAAETDQEREEIAREICRLYPGNGMALSVLAERALAEAVE